MAQSVSTLTKLQRQSFPGDDKDPATIYDLRKIQDSIANSLDPVVQFLTQFQSDQTNTNAQINGNLSLYQLLSQKDQSSGYVGRDASNRLSIAATNLTEVVPASPVANRDYAGMLPHPISSNPLSGASTTISLPGDTRYAYIIVRLRDVIPATNSVDFWLRVNAGSGIDSGAGAYRWANLSWAPIKAVGADQSTGDTKIQLTATGNGQSNSSSGGGLSGSLILPSPGNAIGKKFVLGELAYDNIGGGATVAFQKIGGQYINATTALTQIQFLYSSGNITSGTCDLYGLLAV